MHTDETPFEPASPEVASWVARLNAISKDFKSGTVTIAQWQSFLQESLSQLPTDGPSRSKSGGFRFNGLTFIELTFRDSLAAVSPNLTIHEWCGCRFLNCDFTGIGMQSTDLRGAEFVECLLQTKLRDSNLTGAQLKYCNLRGCNLTNSQLVRARVIGCDLRGVTLECCDLTDADFRAVEFDSRTEIKALESSKGWRVDRHSIACLNNFSGLTVGNRSDMKIRDDVAELRKQFAGLLGFLHVVSLAAFLAPYAWFLVSHWAVARFEGETANTISLGWALLRYFVNAGVDWQSGFNPNWGLLTVSILILLYNLVRFVLLWKTNRLETAERISGVPIRFSLTEPVAPPKWLSWVGARPIWNWLYLANKFGYVLYLGFVALKTWHFLTMRIPLNV